MPVFCSSVVCGFTSVRRYCLSDPHTSSMGLLKVWAGCRGLPTFDPLVLKILLGPSAGVLGIIVLLKTVVVTVVAVYERDQRRLQNFRVPCCGKYSLKHNKGSSPSRRYMTCIPPHTFIFGGRFGEWCWLILFLVAYLCVTQAGWCICLWRWFAKLEINHLDSLFTPLQSFLLVCLCNQGTVSGSFSDPTKWQANTELSTKPLPNSSLVPRLSPRMTATTVKEGESLVPFRAWCVTPLHHNYNELIRYITTRMCWLLWQR